MAQYVTTAEIKAALGIASADTADDASITLAIDSASAMLEKHCGRRFDKDPNTAAGAAGTSARSYRIRKGLTRLDVDDIDPTGPAPTVVWTGATVGGSSVAGFGPLNAAADGRPLTFLLMLDASGVPTDELLLAGLVTITARHGWPAVPPEVRQAALVQAMRLHQRRQAPFGIAGSPEVGSEMRLLSRLDPDVEALVRPYVKGWYVR